MQWYFYLSWLIIIFQALFVFQMYTNYKYIHGKYRKKREHYMRTVLIVPCKGLESNFEKNISSFYRQDYDDYVLWFVVDKKTDTAYEKLVSLKEQLASVTKAKEVQILIAGQGQFCSNKIHSLLHCYERISDDIQAMAFADSDICVRSDWLRHIIYPLRQPKNGAVSGYRWFVPQKNNLATLALSAINAKVAQLLGNIRFNQIWGGSMAITVENFRKLKMDQIWENALSDDLSLSYAIKKAGLQVDFAPGCLVASYESTNWKDLFEFGRRQYLITRVTMPTTWLFAFICALNSIASLWGTMALALYAASINAEHMLLFTSVPCIVFASQMTRAVLRQRMIAKVLKDDKQNMKAAFIADTLFFWAWTPLMFILILSSAFGRVICWRGVYYKLLGPTETIKLTP